MLPREHGGQLHVGQDRQGREKARYLEDEPYLPGPEPRLVRVVEAPKVYSVDVHGALSRPCKPPIRLRSVVFPEPDLPTIIENSPSCMVRLRSSTALTRTSPLSL